MSQVQQVGDLVSGADDYVTEWVRRELEMTHPFGPAQSLGIVKDGKIIAGVVYSNLLMNSLGIPHSCEVAVASIHPSWCTRGNLRAIFRYPFEQLNLVYIWGLVKRPNKRARDFDRRLGFKELCVIPKGNPDGGDMVMYQMLKKNCKWL